jgi:D-alanyl-D-alanine carboxypeptidase
MPRASRRGDPGDYIASRQEVAPAAVAVALPRHDAPTPDKRPARVVPAPETQARAVLDKASKKAPTILAEASPFTAVYQKGGDTSYRARFGGFSSKTQAWDACGALKKRKIACYAVEQ